MHTKRLSDILNIFPIKYIGDSIDQYNGQSNDASNNGETTNENENENHSIEQSTDNNSMEHENGIVANCNTNDKTNDVEHRKKFSIKHSDHALFTHYLKVAIDLDRSERLSEMIKTTGFQLYNTFIGSNSGGGPYADGNTSNANDTKSAAE